MSAGLLRAFECYSLKMWWLTGLKTHMFVQSCWQLIISLGIEYKASMGQVTLPTNTTKHHCCIPFFCSASVGKLKYQETSNIILQDALSKNHALKKEIGTPGFQAKEKRSRFWGPTWVVPCLQRKSKGVVSSIFMNPFENRNYMTSISVTRH